jgi:hypothetical protein
MITILTVFLWAKITPDEAMWLHFNGMAVVTTIIALAQDITLILFLHALAV